MHNYGIQETMPNNNNNFVDSKTVRDVYLKCMYLFYLSITSTERKE